MGDDKPGKITIGWDWLADMKGKTIKYDRLYPEQVQKSTEELLREEHPALQDAWEKYQAVLRLVKVSS